MSERPEHTPAAAQARKTAHLALLPDLEAIRQALIASASARHAEHHQYDGYWDGWDLGQARRRVCWKNYPEYVQIEAGDFALLKPSDFRLWMGPCNWTAYLEAPFGCNTSVWPGDFDRVLIVGTGDA